MYYITLDLEWNQAYAQQALAVQKRIECRLRGEVIQIGAVKLDADMRICGSYSIIVKPKYFKKIHRHVSALTGISQELMDSGTPLPDAAESFRKWCGKDFAFLTWGPDDIPMLKENLHAHGIDGKWLDSTYDLQKIFNRQTDGLMSKQRSLEYAMEYYEIEQKLPAHDALNDAYFTALVAMKMDVPAGIKAYDDLRGEVLAEAVLGDADAGDDGYVTIPELLRDEAIVSPLCPLCNKPLSQIGKHLHSKGQKYTFLYECKKDGKIFLTLRVFHNFNDTFRGKIQFTYATADKIAELEESIKKIETVRRQRRSHRRRKPAKKDSAGV